MEEASLALVELTLAALSGVEGLSALQMRTLLAVDRHGPLNLSTLAGLLEMSVPSASRLVDRLVEAGLVARSVAEHSRRELALTLTPAGRRALSQLRRTRQRGMRPILDGMSGSDRTALVAGLQAFTAAAQASRDRG